MLTWYSVMVPPPGSTALSWSLADALLPLGARAQAFDDLNALIKAVTAAARQGSSALILYLHGFRSSSQSCSSRASMVGALRVNAVTRQKRYYLIAATGDEVLDYREMLAHYRVPGPA